MELPDRSEVSQIVCPRTATAQPSCPASPCLGLYPALVVVNHISRCPCLPRAPLLHLSQTPSLASSCQSPAVAAHPTCTTQLHLAGISASIPLSFCWSSSITGGHALWVTIVVLANLVLHRCHFHCAQGPGVFLAARVALNSRGSARTRRNIAECVTVSRMR